MTQIQILSPFSGAVVPMEDVPDPVFAQKMLGDGLAVHPDEGLAVAPISGKLIIFHSAGHAFAIEAAKGHVTVLVHIGLDTVRMKGEGFRCLAQVGDYVSAGQRLVEFNLNAIIKAGYSVVSPVLVPEPPDGTKVVTSELSHVIAGTDTLLTVLTP